MSGESVSHWGMMLQLLNAVALWVCIVLSIEGRIGRKVTMCAVLIFALFSVGTLYMVNEKPWRERRCLIGQEGGTGRLLIDFLPLHDGMDVTMTVWDAENPEVKKTKSLHTAEWQHLQYYDYGWDSNGVAYLQPREGMERPLDWRITLP